MSRRSSLATVSTLLTLAGLMLLTAPVAQAQQAGFIRQQAVLARMPEMQQAQQQLQGEIESEQREIQAEQQEIQQELARLEEQGGMMSQENMQARFQELQTQLEESRAERQQRIAELENELVGPVFERFQSAVDEVAANRDLDFVVRYEVLLYVDDDDMVDITEAVASRLGVDLQARAVPGSGR